MVQDALTQTSTGMLPTSEWLASICSTRVLPDLGIPTTKIAVLSCRSPETKGALKMALMCRRLFWSTAGSRGDRAAMILLPSSRYCQAMSCCLQAEVVVRAEVMLCSAPKADSNKLIHERYQWESMSSNTSRHEYDSSGVSHRPAACSS